MLKALLVITALGLPQGDDGIATQSGLSSSDWQHAGTVVLARGGRDRVDPFAEIKERRRQEAKEKREQEQRAPKKALQGQSN